jgi:hypothetical protein
VVVWDWAPQGSNYKIMARTVTQNPSCPALGPCPASPRLGCKQPTIHLKGNLTLKDKTPDDRDGVVWKWVNGEATSVPENGDALATDSYSFCLYDGNDTLLAASTVPPGGTCTGGPCWKTIDCWWEIFDVERFLQDHLSPAEFERMVSTRPASKAAGLAALAERIKRDR